MPIDSNIICPPQGFASTCQAFARFHGLKNRAPRLDFLEDILSAFSRIPYENLSKIIKYQQCSHETRLRMPDEVMASWQRHGLGGTCFSLTYFLHAIVIHWGFVAYPVMADMSWGENVHCALVVDLEGERFLVDPGYLLNRPLILDVHQPRIYKTEYSGVELRAGHTPSEYQLFTFDRHQTKWRYRFLDQPVSLADFFHFWMNSFDWTSMNGLCLTRVEKDRLIYVHKTFMRETGFYGKKNYNLKHNLHDTIQRVFGIAPEIVEEALAAIEENKARKRQNGLWVPNNKDAMNET